MRRSPFASQTQSDPIPCPWDPAAWVIVRRLTGREVDAAAEAHRGQVQSGSVRAWPATLRRMLEHGASDPDVLKAIADPLLGYDRYALVRAGLVAWSYPQPVKFTPADKVDGKVDAIEDLDDEACDFIAREVLRLTKPALFLTTVQDVEVAQKELPAAVPAA